MTVAPVRAGYDANLSDLQVEGADWLRGRPRRLLADPPGFGKTRTLLAAVGEKPTLIVCPAAIRDAQVWPGEIARTGWGGEATVISYHQLAAWKNNAPKKAFELGVEAVIFDESHHLKNRKVSWAHPAQRLGEVLETVYEASGTPTPNIATELWGQLRVLRGKDLKAYWPWVNDWFVVQSTYFSDYDIPGTLLGCVEDRCHNALVVTDRECEHWDRFRREVLEGWLLARSEDLLDLPPMSGADTPLWTPMTPGQKKAYKSLQKDFLAEWVDPATGEIRDIESVSDSQKFINLWQMSTGVGSVDPAADDRDSGKLKLIAEMLEDRSSPTLLACYFRNTGQILQNVCKRLGKRYVTFGANDSSRSRRDAVARFQAGDVDVMVGSIAVVGEGLTLTAGDGVWLAERMWTPDKNTQVIRRVRRRGQDKPVGVRQFVTPDSVDAGQWLALEAKVQRVSQVDPVRLTYGELAFRDAG